MKEDRSSADQLDRFLDLALNGLLEILGMDTGWLHLLARGRDRPLASACQGCSAEMKHQADSLALHEAGRPAADAGVIIMPDLSGKADPAVTSFQEAGFASLIVVPLRTNLFQGSLGAVSREPNAFDGQSAEILKLKASLIGAVLQKGAISQGLAGLLAEQAQPVKRKKENKSITAIAGNQFRRVRQAMEKADKKFTQATINLLKEPGWEGLLEEYEGGPSTNAGNTPAPGTITFPETLEIVQPEEQAELVAELASLEEPVESLAGVILPEEQAELVAEAAPTEELAGPVADLTPPEELIMPVSEAVPREEPEEPLAEAASPEEPEELVAGAPSLEEPVEPAAETAPIEELAEYEGEVTPPEEPVEIMAEVTPPEEPAMPVTEAAPQEEPIEPEERAIEVILRLEPEEPEAELAPENTFEAHADRMEAFRRSHANLE